nr:hypothetical protein [Tanacetum cinerariifolium]
MCLVNTSPREQSALLIEKLQNKSNVPATSTTIHFIKQAVDDYHVTVYNNDGSEYFGYDRRAVGPRLIRPSMVVIGGDGLGLTKEEIYPTLLKRLQRKIQYRDIKDKRLEQICSWPFHREHLIEDNVFYTPLCAYVSDCYTLTIPAEFCTQARVMHTYKKEYIVHQNISEHMIVFTSTSRSISAGLKTGSTSIGSKAGIAWW